MQFTLKAFVLAFVAAFATNVAAAPAPLPVPEPLKPLRAADVSYFPHDLALWSLRFRSDFSWAECLLLQA